MLKHGPHDFLFFGVIVIDPFFITSDYTMQKTFLFMPGKQHFTCEKSAFNVSQSASVHMELNSFAFEFPMISNDMKLLSYS